MWSTWSSFLTTCCLTHTLTTLLLHTYHYTSVRLFVHTYSPIKVTPDHSLWSSCRFLVTSILLHTYCDTSDFHHVPPCHLLFYHVPCYSSTPPVTCAHSHTSCSPWSIDPPSHQPQLLTRVLLHVSLWWLSTPLRLCPQTGALLLAPPDCGCLLHFAPSPGRARGGRTPWVFLAVCPDNKSRWKSAVLGRCNVVRGQEYFWLLPFLHLCLDQAVTDNTSTGVGRG